MRILDNALYQSDIAQVSDMDLPWEKLNNKTILLTGATGMIASAIIDILMRQNKEQNRNIQICAISRKEQKARERFETYWNDPAFTWCSHDINNPFPEFGNMDYILHAASNTHPRAYASDPIGTIAANVQGTYQLLNYAVGHCCKRFLFFSSVEIYGENRNDVDKFDEQYLGYIDCNTVRAGYPESKRLGETLCNAFAEQKGQDFVIGRFSRVYGPTMSMEDSKAVAQMIRKAAAGENIMLKSEGNQLYSYTYVVDAASAALYLLLKGESRSAVNVVDSASDICLRDLAVLLAEEAETKVVFELPDAIEKAGYSTATKALLDGMKIERLGWKAYTSIRQGLPRTVQILRQTGRVQNEHSADTSSR